MRVGSDGFLAMQRLIHTVSATLQFRCHNRRWILRADKAATISGVSKYQFRLARGRERWLANHAYSAPVHRPHNCCGWRGSLPHNEKARAFASTPDCCRYMDDANLYIGFGNRSYQRRRRRKDEGLRDALPTGARFRRVRRHCWHMRFGLHNGAGARPARSNLRYPGAVLGFHAAGMFDDSGKRVVSATGTQDLMKTYPASVRAWIARHGGLTPKTKYLRGRDLAAIVSPCDGSRMASASRTKRFGGAHQAADRSTPRATAP
jgi:hypothetical protein